MQERGLPTLFLLCHDKTCIYLHTKVIELKFTDEITKSWEGNYIPIPPLLDTPLYIHDGNVCDYNHHDDNYYGGGDADDENRLSMMTNHFDS